MNEIVRSKQRNVNLDLLKVMACIAVVGLHTCMPYALPLYYLCGFAVPVFFMASGYVLMNKSNITWNYTKHKIGVILRMVVAWSVLRWFMSLSGILLGKDISEYSILYLVKQILGCLIQKGKMWQFWYFGALIIIYLFLPLLHRIYKKRIVFRSCTISLVCVLWGFLLMTSVVIQTCSMICGEALQQNVIQTFRLWSWLQYFILGGLLVNIFPVIADKVSVRIHFTLLCISSALIVLYQYTVGKDILNTLYAEYFYDSILMFVWIAILFTWVLRIKFSETQGHCISILCGLTLGVYIIHPTVISVVTKIISVNSFGMAVVSFLAVAAISFIIIYVMSKIKIIKKYLLTM